MNLNFTKIGFKFILKQIFLLSLFLAFISNKAIAENQILEIANFKQIEFPNEMETSTEENQWTLSYSDEKIKVYLQKMNCDGKDSYKLRIENLTTTTFNISYKLWETADAKEIILTPFANVEGICSAGYGYKLIEEIPKSLKDTKINISIKYLL